MTLSQDRSVFPCMPLRTLYAFDPLRNAILLIGGDKTGDGRRYVVNQRWSRKTEHADKWKSCSDGRG